MNTDNEANQFFKECVADGRLTKEEYEGLAVDRERSGCTKPEWRTLRGLTEQDLLIWINTPAWTQEEIAEYLGITRYEVRAALVKIVRTFPGLRPIYRSSGLPCLHSMVSIDVIDDNTIKRKF